MKHRNILPLIGFWKSFFPGKESVELSFITPWLDDGDLLHYLKAHPDVDCAQRLKYVSFDFIDYDCYPANCANMELRDVADALSYSEYPRFKRLAF